MLKGLEGIILNVMLQLIGNGLQTIKNIIILGKGCGENYILKVSMKLTGKEGIKEG